MIYTLAMVSSNERGEYRDLADLIGITYYPVYTDHLQADDFITLHECIQLNKDEPHLALAEWLKSGKIFYGTFDQMLQLRQELVEDRRNDRLVPSLIQAFGFCWQYQDYANLQIVNLDDIFDGPIMEYGYKILCKELDFPFDEDYL
jgi:hypothetical protein